MKYIGVAVGQTVTCTATPLDTIRAEQGVPDWEKVTALFNCWRPNLIMVGMPFSLDGSEQCMTNLVHRFVGELTDRYHIPIETVDERFTTQEARQYLFERGGFRALKKSSVDGLSAKIIVESGFKKLGYTIAP